MFLGHAHSQQLSRSARLLVEVLWDAQVEISSLRRFQRRLLMEREKTLLHSSFRVNLRIFSAFFYFIHVDEDCCLPCIKLVARARIWTSSFAVDFRFQRRVPPIFAEHT